MRMLAIDSSGLVASVALIEDDVLLGEFSTNFHKTHSVTLLPMLDELMKILSIDVREAGIDGIAVAKGPGSFTGLRIGAATAKGLALALDVPIYPVSTLEGLAFNVWGISGIVCPIMDARRNQVYTALYRFEKKTNNIPSLYEESAPSARAFLELASELNEKEAPVTFIGDGIPVFSEQARELLKVPFCFAPAPANRQRAASIGSIAILRGPSYGIKGKDFSPDYLRLSQAERERLAREQGS